MFLDIKKRIEEELLGYSRSIEKTFHLKRLSPLLLENIREFILRDGKRVRPILFVIGYLGFKNRPAPGLYRSAVSLELLHDFMLVHDDIIDKSPTRRGKPSMHALLNNYLKKKNNIKFSGEDLAIVIGDVIYAMALEAYLAVKEKSQRKEATLRKLFLAALYTGSGEFIELILGAKPLELTTQSDIYKVYDYKTANYTFASPLTMGATLAGAKKTEIDKLFEYGMTLGRAFQIKDDIIGLFSEAKDTGKSNLTDLEEAKRTILIWYAYKNADKRGKALIKNIFSGGKPKIEELKKVKELIINTGSLDYAKSEIKRLSSRAQGIIKSSRMHKKYISALENFSQEILKA